MNEARQGEFGKIEEESESEEEEEEVASMDEVSLSSLSEKNKEKNLNEIIQKKKIKFELRKEEVKKRKNLKKIKLNKALKSKTSLEKSNIDTSKESKKVINSLKNEETKFSIQNLDLKYKSKEQKKRKRKKKLKMSDSMNNIISSFGENKKLYNYKKEKLLSTIRGYNITSPKKLKPYAKSQLSLNNSINKSSKEIKNYSFNTIHALFKNNTKNFRTKKKRSKISNHLLTKN